MWMDTATGSLRVLMRYLSISCNRLHPSCRMADPFTYEKRSVVLRIPFPSVRAAWRSISSLARGEQRNPSLTFGALFHLFRAPLRYGRGYLLPPATRALFLET